MLNARFLLALMLHVGGLSVAGANAPQAASTIVVFGDSTTAPRADLMVYSSLLETELRANGFSVAVINAGVNGNTTEDAARRFSAEVIDRRPDLVVLQFGINDSAIDVWKSPSATQPRVSIENFGENMAKFVAALKEREIRVVLMTPNPLRWTLRLVELYGRPPYDVTDPEGMNVTLDHYADVVRRLAAETHAPLIDIMAAHREKPLNQAESLLSDGMHPNQRGHALVATRLAELIRREGLLPPAKR